LKGNGLTVSTFWILNSGGDGHEGIMAACSGGKAKIENGKVNVSLTGDSSWNRGGNPLVCQGWEEGRGLGKVGILDLNLGVFLKKKFHQSNEVKKLKSDRRKVMPKEVEVRAASSM